FALDQSISGGVQLDTHWAPTAKDPTSQPLGPSNFDVEAALRLDVDLSKNVAVGMKMCFGCHGLESESVYADFWIADEAKIRVGRFTPSVGSFSPRQD